MCLWLKAAQENMLNEVSTISQEHFNWKICQLDPEGQMESHAGGSRLLLVKYAGCSLHRMRKRKSSFIGGEVDPDNVQSPWSSRWGAVQHRDLSLHCLWSLNLFFLRVRPGDLLHLLDLQHNLKWTLQEMEANLCLSYVRWYAVTFLPDT